MKEKRIIKNLTKIFKKPATLFSDEIYNNIIREYFNGKFEYSNKNIKSIFNTLFLIDINKNLSQIKLSGNYIEVRNSDLDSYVNGSYNQYFNKIILYKHNHENKLYNRSLDFVSELHESIHATHHFNTIYKTVNNKQYDCEIDKMLSTCWTIHSEDYVNFEELITRMQTFIRYFDLLQKDTKNKSNPIPLTRETLYVIYETVVDCYTYKYAIKETTVGKYIKDFKCNANYIPPKFDVNFCLKHFENYYYSIAVKLEKNQIVDFDKLRIELTNLANIFDIKAHKYFELAEKNFYCPKGNIYFNPTKNVANTLLALMDNYDYIKDEVKKEL